MSTDATNTAAVSTNQQQQVHLPQLAIMDRLQKIQLVNQAMDLANKSYLQIKSSNGLVEATLTKAESMAEQLAKPMLNHLEQPIQIADKYACQGFDKIESSVQTLLTQNASIELVRKRLEESVQVLQTSTKQLREIMERGMDQTKNRVESLRKQTSEHFNSMLNVSETFIRSVDNSLNAAENALDRLMPALNPESSQPTTTPSSIDNLPSIDQANGTAESLRHLFQRIGRISDKIRRRIGQHTVEKWYQTFLQSAENFQQNILQILQTQASKYPALTSAIIKTATAATTIATTGSDTNATELKPKQS